MKKIFSYFSFWLLIQVILYAQTESLLLDTKITIAEKDSSQTFMLTCSKDLHEKVEGYLCLPFDGNSLSGEIIPGGFSFLNDKIFGDPIPFFADKWVKNKFPMEDIAPITNRTTVGKILSFQIEPKQISETSDSMYLLFKYCIYDLTKRNQEDFSFDYRIKLFYKFVAVPFNRTISFDFINAHFKDQQISFLFKKTQKAEVLSALKNNDIIFDELMNSVDASRIVDKGYKLGIEFVQKDINTSNDPFDVEYFLKVQQDMLGETKIEKSFQWNKEKKGTVPVYFAHLNFPFKLYNQEKAKPYNSYTTKAEIFKSDYDIILVPISFNKDTLLADMFIIYSKLITNEIGRWTPIKKRLKLVHNLPVGVELPKENWSVNSSINGERYDIYGYSDFERYVSEHLIVHFNKTKDSGE